MKIQFLAQLMAMLLPMSAFAGDMGVGTCEPDGVQDSGAIYRVCLPQETEWNRDLVIYCHGYVRPDGQVDLPEDQFCFGEICIYELFTQFGYAFAATSYSTHGVAVREGMADVLDLVNIFTAEHGKPDNIILLGFSEGAQISVLLAEQYPELFDGIVAACGPIGNWQMQIDYVGDFRVLFDVFFPGLIPGSPLDIPTEVVDDWDNLWENMILPELRKPENRWKVRQLMAYTGGPYTPLNRDQSSWATIRAVLWFNIVGTNDAVEKLGGQPYENTRKLYRGGIGSTIVNAMAERVEADGAARETIAQYFETSGNLQVPTVILHTFLDPQVPYWHVPMYQLKLIRAGANRNTTHIPVAAYGHCAFSPVEVVAAFTIAVFRGTGEFPDFSILIDDPSLVDQYLKIVETHLF